MKTTLTQRYLALCLIAFIPSLHGCLFNAHLKGDIDVESEEPTYDQSHPEKDDEGQTKEPEKV